MKAIISKAARRKWAWVLALVMVVSIVIPTSLLTVKADVGTVKFIDGGRMVRVSICTVVH